MHGAGFIMAPDNHSAQTPDIGTCRGSMANRFLPAPGHPLSFSSKIP
jgi:hypothetical protein